MKDEYKKLSREWGSKSRKEDSRAAKNTLKKATREELAEVEFDRIMKETYLAMANPPAECERCNCEIDASNRTWTGSAWYCDSCAEETAG